MSRRWRLAIAGFVLGLPVLALLVGLGLLRLSLPPEHSRIEVHGLDGPVAIHFDAWGRPYVRAESLQDAIAAQGYVHARDRLWQMELLRRSGRGRLAELLGEAALDTDETLHRIGVPRLADALAANADENDRALVERYVAGVNAGIASLRLPPPEFLITRRSPQPWTAADVFAIGAVMAFDTSRNFHNELLRLAIARAMEDRDTGDGLALFLPDESRFPEQPYPFAEVAEVIAALDATTQLRPTIAFGSNAWAVAPARTRDGHALLAFDPHGGWGLPNSVFEVHLFFTTDNGEPGQLRGWGVAGLPGIVYGFNERMAWGFTSTGDSQDLYLEERDGDDPLSFRGRDGRYRARTETIEIPVRGREEPHRFELLHTENGPLIRDEPPIALAWSARELDGLSLGGLFAVNRALDPQAMQAALDTLPAPSTLMTWADVDGRIGSRVAGRLPVRGRGEGLLPLPAVDPDTAWTGYVPMDQLPRITDPPSGYSAAANSRVTPPGASPLISADNAPGYRMRRLQQVFAGDAVFDLEAMARLQVDVRSVQAEMLLPRMLSAIDGAALDAIGEHSRRLLTDWQAQADQHGDSAAALLFEQWYIALAETVFEPLLGPDLLRRLKGANYVLNHALDSLLLLPEHDPQAAVWWTDGRATMLARSFDSAVTTLQMRLGERPDEWRWDALHKLHFEHMLGSAAPLLDRLFDRGPFPWGGGNATLGRARYNYNEPFVARAGAHARVVVELSRPIRARAIIPGGQSGHPMSPHYDDQFDAFLAGELHPLADAPEVVGEPMALLHPGAVLPEHLAPADQPQGQREQATTGDAAQRAPANEEEPDGRGGNDIARPATLVPSRDAT